MKQQRRLIHLLSHFIFKSIKTHNKQTKIESVSKKKKNKVKDTQKQTKNMQIKVNKKYMLKKQKHLMIIKI